MTMRPFQPISRSFQPQQPREQWTLQPAVRWIALCIFAVSAVLLLSFAWDLEHSILKAQRDPTCGASLAMPISYLAVATPMAMMFLCVPLIAPFTNQPKKRHIADPALSILPR